MPRVTENIFTKAMADTSEDWATVQEAARVALLHGLDDVLRAKDRKPVMRAIMWAIRCAGREAHAAKAIADGYIYDGERFHRIEADPLRKQAPAMPDPNLIDGFDFTGMDWGEDEPTPAAV